MNLKDKEKIIKKLNILGNLTEISYGFKTKDVRKAILEFEELQQYITSETYDELNFGKQNRFKFLLHKYKISSFNLPNEIQLHKIIFGDWEK